MERKVKYDLAFKLKYVKEVLEKYISVTSISSREGFNKILLNKWIVDCESHGVLGLEHKKNQQYSAAFKLSVLNGIKKHLGLLTKGHFTEVSRTDFIAGYQGQTALKVKKVIEKAKGGVLFIDEAYSITENEHIDSHGKECLTELTKALEDYIEDLVVIVAGYTDPMNKFFNSNPGLKSRFNTFVEFNDYSDSEVVEILLKLFENSDYDISADGINEIKDLIETNRQNPNGQFSNGRFIRNIYEDLIMKHARRVSEIEQPNIRELKEITETDIRAILENL